MIIFLLTFALSVFINIVSTKKRIFPDSTIKPQRVHRKPVPRAGGLGIVIASLFYGLVNAFPVFLSSLPAFLTGIYEDSGRTIKPKIRLFLQSLSAIVFILITGNLLTDLGILDVPSFIAPFFTIFAIVGVINALNLIDGLNGLASGVTIVALLFLGLVAKQEGDMYLYKLSFVILFATLGFFILNFPWGKIFLGDGGAYFLGFMLAVISIMLVNRNPDASPWYPVLLLAYPIFDTLFSIYRRVRSGRTPLEPDKLHLHSLLYKRVFKNNPLTSAVIVLTQFVLAFVGFVVYKNHYAIIGLMFIFCLTYVVVYYSLIKFKFQAWIPIRKQ
ncbi:MAG: undecaprenyl/decaprenyl-phosphate alpha-N-acetylglucosaminyl 1-phosphate transferase [Aquificae bacterium]|nr:undecaprenyl/decaprenyl-phosphate alpha-N-acetylglucosaminyl 1-phosphate transferase [Aquificota bacterium]